MGLQGLVPCNTLMTCSANKQLRVRDEKNSKESASRSIRKMQRVAEDSRVSSALKRAFMTLKEMFLGMPASERSRMFLTVKEAASILAKKASSVRRMIDEDKLKGVKVGGTWWVYRPSLEELVQDS